MQSPISSIPTGHLRQSSADSETGSDGNVTDKPCPHVQTPTSHTAASRKMLHHWPRIKMSTTFEAFEALRYVENTDGAGFPPLLNCPAAEAVRIHILAHSERALRDATGVYLLLCQI
ncbi:hypothetical protein F5Y16DRAFT_129047 [Xylariaceae sp. FL0255]|nr:hypothetical protein F5Y16DRAFT_129047 [Xylariaceae sp. FL0255]